MSTDILDLPIESLVPHPDNPRFELSGEALDSLAKSLKETGLLQNLVCRPHPKQGGKHQVLCGHRRLAAAKKAGLKELRCAVRDLNDADALALMVTENLHREDLHPLEQAAGIERLISAGMPVETVADRLGKSQAWVARRQQLSRLTKEWKTAIGNPKLAVALMPSAQLELIARLPENVQREVLDEFKGSKAVDGSIEKWRFDQVMGGTMHVLSAAPWPIDDAGLVPAAGPCSTCPKRSSQNPLLFEDIQGKRGGPSDRCLDPACWKRKHERLVEVNLAAARKEHGEVVCLDNAHEMDIEVPGSVKRIQPYEASICKQGDKGARAAVRASDGEIVWVRSNRASGNGDAAKQHGKPKSAEETRRGRRAAYVIGKVTEGIGRIAKNKEAAAAIVKDGAHTFTSLAVAFGTSSEGRLDDGDDWKRFDKALKTAGNENIVRFVQQFADSHWIDFPSLGHANAMEVLPQARRAAEVFQLDFDAFEREAAEKFPEPHGNGAKPKPKSPSKRARGKKPSKARK